MRTWNSYSGSTSNTCVPCPADLVVDWPTASATCEPTSIPVDLAPAAGDVCPDKLIVEVTGLSSGGPLIPAVTSPESPSCGGQDATFGVVDLTGYELWYYHSPSGILSDPCSDLVCTLERCDPGCGRVMVSGELVSCDFFCMDPATCTWATPSSVSWPDAVRLVVNGPDGVGASLSLTPVDYPEECGTPTL